MPWQYIAGVQQRFQSGDVVLVPTVLSSAKEQDLINNVTFGQVVIVTIVSMLFCLLFYFVLLLFFNFSIFAGIIFLEFS